MFVDGIRTTVCLSLASWTIAVLIGLFIAVCRMAPSRTARLLGTAYVEIFRNVPLLVQIFFWYFAVLLPLPGPKQSLNIGDAFFLSNRGLNMPGPAPGEGFLPFVIALALTIAAIFLLVRWVRKRFEATGETFPALITSIAMLLVIPGLAVLVFGNPFDWTVPEMKGFNFRGGLVVIPELIALTLALSIYTESFIAEIVRSGIQAVSHGQTEAARSLGLKPSVTLRKVIIPQALRVIIPPLTSQYLNLVKNSSLAAGIGYPDMVSLFAGTVLNQTGQAIEVIAITMSVYLSISISISILMNWYNSRIALVER